MGQPKKSFEDRIKESEEFIKAGNLKSAISTLVKAKRDDPTKAKAIDLGKSIEGLQNRMDAEEKPAEKPDIELPVTDEKPEEKPVEEKVEEKNEEQLKEELDELNDKLGEEKSEKIEDELKEESKPVDPPIDETKKEKKIADDDLDPDEIIEFKVINSFQSDKGHHSIGDIIKWERHRKSYKDRVVALEDL